MQFTITYTGDLIVDCMASSYLTTAAGARSRSCRNVWNGKTAGDNHVEAPVYTITHGSLLCLSNLMPHPRRPLLSDPGERRPPGKRRTSSRPRMLMTAAFRWGVNQAMCNEGVILVLVVPVRHPCLPTLLSSPPPLPPPILHSIALQWSHRTERALT